MAKDTEQDEAQKSSGGRKSIILIGIVVSVLVAEGAGVFVFVKSLSKSAQPATAAAAATEEAGGKVPESQPGGLIPHEGKPEEPELEVKIGEFRIQNRKGQLAYNLNFTVFVSLVPTPAADPAEKPKGEGGEGGEKEKEKAAAAPPSGADALVAAKAAKIKDRFSRAVRTMEPEQFVEPALTGLKAKLKEELSSVMGPDFRIREVLVTDFTCTPEN